MSEIFIIENENLLNSSQIDSLNADKHIIKVSINNLQCKIKYNYFYIDDKQIIDEVLLDISVYKKYNFILNIAKLKISSYQKHKNIKNINRFMTEFYCDIVESLKSEDIIQNICFHVCDFNNPQLYILSDSLKTENLQHINDIKHFNIEPYTIKIDKNIIKKKKISICFNHYNRTFVDIGNNCIRPIFLNSLQSVKNTIDDCVLDDISFEICILDNSKDGVIPIKKWVNKFLKGYNYILKTLKYKEVRFSDKTMMDRGLGRNIIGDMATGDYILWLDTDMIINRNLIMEGLKEVYKNHIFFPVCFYYLTPDNQYGFWANGGYGNVMMTRKSFKRNKWPQYPEHTLSYEEDVEYFKKLKQSYKVVERRIDDYFHQYHPGKMVDKVWIRDFKEHNNINIDLTKTINIQKFLKECKL